MNNILANYMSQIVLSLFLMLAAWLGVQAKNLYNKHVTTEVKQAVCRTCVRFVEQVYTDLHGREKLRKAMERATQILATYDIHISENELEAMLEAAVNEFNKSFKKTDPEAKAKAELEKSFYPPLPEL
jgi:Phage holin protein (Holin_LLH).